jgi:hypothetical protein
MCLALSGGISGHAFHEKEGRDATIVWLNRHDRRVDGWEAGAWEHCLDGADAVINLAGAPIVDGRWNDARKRLLTESRVLSTRLLVEAMSADPPNRERSLAPPVSATTGPVTTVCWMRGPHTAKAFRQISVLCGKRRRFGLRSSVCESSYCGPEWCSNKTAVPCRRCCCRSGSSRAALSCPELSGYHGSTGAITSD